jgi:hypothetical protein
MVHDMLTAMRRRSLQSVCAASALALAGCASLQAPTPTAPARVGPLPTPVPSATLGAPARLPATATGPALPVRSAETGVTTSALPPIGTPAIRQATPTPQLARVNRLPTIAERPAVAQLPLVPRYEFTEALSGTTPVLLVAIPGEISFRVQTLGARPGAGFPRYSIAPNQRFLAYYSGSAGACCSLDQPASAFDRAVTIVSLLDGSILASVRVFNAEFPATLLRAAGSERDAAERAYGASLAGLDRFIWAPDSATFYFAAFRDGEHSDVYAIDVLRGSTQRLSDAPGQIASFSISPDRRWLITMKRDAAESSTVSAYAVRLDGSQSRDLGAAWGDFVGWIGPNSGALARRDGVAGLRDASVFDLERGVLRRAWDGPIFDAHNAPDTSALTFCSPAGNGLRRIVVRAVDLTAAAEGLCGG